LGVDLISNLNLHAQKIASLRDRATNDIKNGYVFEQVPNSELSVWFRVLRFFARLIGFHLAPPKRKRNLSQSERYQLRDKIDELESVLAKVNLQLSVTKKNPELRPVSPGLIDYGDGGYPEDWEQISLQYRQKVGFICEGCGAHARDGHVHHILPVSRGGDSSENNLLFLCKQCHSLKHPHMKEY